MSTPDVYVASLERRIAQLEAIVATLPQGEQNVPNYLSTDSAGNVSAVFTGGVLLPIGDAQANAPVNQARWVKRAADGSLGADIARLEGSWATGATPVSAYRETAISPTTGRQAYVEARASENANLGATGVTVNVTTPAFKSKTLLDGNGNSDFVQLNPPNDQTMSGHDLYVTNGAIRGNVGNTSGASIGCRGGNIMSFDWTGNVLIWVDSTLVRTL